MMQASSPLTLYPKGCSTGAGDRNRTYNQLITSQLPYHWATPAYGDDAGLRTPVAGMKTLYPSPLDDTAIFIVYCERYP